MSVELEKPWFDLGAYRRTRLLEARYELELAKRFLSENLIRNAAGKVFQAWKALVAALLVDKLSELEKLYPGYVKLRSGRRVKKAYWILAIVPTTRLKQLASLLDREAYLYTELALSLHEYQYNGPDREGVLSRYPNDELAKRDITLLIEEVSRRLEAIQKREGGH